MRFEPSLQREITLRPRRQITLPARACRTLGLEPGDQLEVFVANDAVVIRPKRSAALDALRAIQRAFAESDVSEEELQKAGREARQRLVGLERGED